MTHRSHTRFVVHYGSMLVASSGRFCTKEALLVHFVEASTIEVHAAVMLALGVRQIFCYGPLQRCIIKAPCLWI